MIDMSYLKAGQLYWNDWCFAPWSNGSASGLYRRVDFIKAGIIGEVGRYYADDYIIWRYEADDVQRVFSEAKREKGLMLQRFLFLQPSGRPVSKTRCFMMGLRGFAEMYCYTPLTSAPKRFLDLTQLADAAHKYFQAHGPAAE